MRITAVSAGLTLAILLCFALIVGRLASDKIQGEFRDDLERTADKLAFDAGTNTPEFFRRVQLVGDGVIRVVFSDGSPAVAGFADTPNLGPPDLTELKQVGPYEVASERVVTTQLGESPVFVQYAETHASLDATTERLWLLLAGGVLGGAMLAALAGYAVAARAMSPIASLTSAAREVATTRDPSRRLPMPDTEDEVAELAQTLDEMLRELDAARSETEHMVQAQREFVADASHELRTPLTAILANLELLQAELERSGGDPEQSAIVNAALGSSRRMRRLVADLLLLARADAGRSGPRRPCDLAEIAATAIAEVRAVSDDHPIELVSEDSVPAAGNADDLHRLVLNLVENAVRHTPPGTLVTVTLSRDDGTAVLEVADDGPGLPDGVGDQIFARFVRGSGPADIAADSGTGLGLAIVKAVAHAHGGEVEAGTAPHGGALFTVRLPVEPIDEQTLTPEPSPVS
jgi:two-component system OmpR family sensor kinase